MTPAPGHTATRPREIPLAGWKAILRRTWAEAGRDHISLIAAGVAFYGLLALFPAVTALVAIGGLLMEPAQVVEQIDAITRLAPERAAEIIRSQATEIAAAGNGKLGLAAAIGLLLALYSSSKGVSSLVEGLNVAYDERDERGFLKSKLLVLALTLVLIVGLALGIGATVVLPTLLNALRLGPVIEPLIAVGRWVLLFVLAVAAIAVLYRYGPDRARARWAWLTPGAVLACAGWIVTSMLFALYAENFASYNESFDSLAGVIVLLTWLWISAYVVLLGAELDAETELQTGEDTTTGKPMPRGSRGSVKADEVPPAAG